MKTTIVRMNERMPEGVEADHYYFEGRWIEAPVPSGGVARAVRYVREGRSCDLVPTGEFVTRPDGAVAQVWERRAG